MASRTLTEAELQAQLEHARNALQNELTRRQSDPDALTCSSSPDEDARGTIRVRGEMDPDNNDFPPALLEDPLAPYTLEEGRAYKRQKNLSAQSDADADIFLKVLQNTLSPSTF
jgi:hypothetical protein